MNVSAESYGHAVILNLKGEFTEDALAVIQQAVDHHLLSKDHVIDLVFNMEAVPFVDSAALEYLLTLQERLAERLGQVKLVKCDENVLKILEVTRLDTSFELFKDNVEAVKAIAP
jgi:anti-anti-sigma factor